MIEKIGKETDVYISGRFSKVADFFIGLGIFLGVFFVVYLFTTLLFSFLPYIISRNNLSLDIIYSMLFSSLIQPIPAIISLVLSLSLANRYFPNRRFVKIGIWIVVLLPVFFLLILFGACAIAFSQSGGFFN